MILKTFKHLDSRHSIPKIERVETEKGRYYRTPSGILLPSITNVLSSFKAKGLTDWIERVGEAESNRTKNVAARRGTAFHDTVEAYLNNETDILHGVMPDIEQMFKDTRHFLDTIDRVEYVELSLFSEKLGAAGTADAIAEYDGERAVIDFKTSRKTKKDEYIVNYFEQVTGYSLMWEDLTGETINKIVIIVGVDEDDSQVFVRDRRDYEKSLKTKLEEFHVSN
jgi:hypothetical protein